MELHRITLPPLSAPGEVTTFYSFESGTARSMALSHCALQLAGRNNAASPVLMIDWDTSAPGLHHYFGQPAQHLGLLDYFQACREHLALLGQRGAALDPPALARQVVDAVDWERYVERVDHSRPLYLMRAGRFDDSYGERADRMDWDGLFMACPALFRHVGAALAQRFQHVLVDAGSGRSAAVSICTTLLPDKLVGLFAPSQRSLDGLCGVVRRAIDYRCSHEDEQRPLLVYPVPALVDSADTERRQHWRRGDPGAAAPGYQAVLETLLRDCYRMPQLSLDSYLDEVQLQQAGVLASGTLQGSGAGRDADRFSLARTFSTLLDWVADGFFPWQSHAEVALLKTIATARAQLQEHGSGSALALPMARDLHGLGALYSEQGREQAAQDCFEESFKLRQRLLGSEHVETRATRAQLASLLRGEGKLVEARFLAELQLDDCQRLLGGEHPETLAAQAGLALTLSMLGEPEAALALHEQLNQACERCYGSGHVHTFDALAAHAATLARHHGLNRARALFERVLEGRQRLLGAEHADTLHCSEQLAQVLGQLGELVHARKLQEGVVAARDRHLGPDHPSAMQAREVLAEILADSGDLDAVCRVQQALLRSCERRHGAEHPATLSIQLRLASTLGQLGDLDAARQLQQHVVALHERLHGADSEQTVLSKKMLATTLALQGHTLAARRLDDSLPPAGERHPAAPAMVAAGAHDSVGARPAGAAIADPRDHASAPETLEHKLLQLQQLIDMGSEAEARVMADTLRKVVLRPPVAHPTRRRAMVMIKEVYRQCGDTDALLGIMQDEVSLLEGALHEAAGGQAVAAPQ